LDDFKDFFAKPLLARLRALLSQDTEIYLVGGAVRDVLLGRESQDFDFVLPRDTLRVARRLADALGGAYFPLDEERQTARIVLESSPDSSHAQRIKLDFATFQGDDLEADLRGRDFTINALAVDFYPPHAIFDPLGGASDLVARRLRVCAPDALSKDPVRILRGIRLALEYNLKFEPETRQFMRMAAGELYRSSPERLRDEFFHILDGHQPGVAIQLLQRLGVLEVFLPEIYRLQGVNQSAPHVYDVWQHTIETLRWLGELLETLGILYDPDQAASLWLGLVSLRLGRYRQQLEEHLRQTLNLDRSLRSLLFLAALYHDAGKPDTSQLDDQGRWRFFEHEQVSEALLVSRGQELRLSNLEIDRIKLIVRHHMRPFHLGQSGGLPSRRAIYRFFRDTGPAGVDICLLSLADMLATHGTTLKQEAWSHHLDVIRSLLEAWWEHPQEQVAPVGLMNGDDLMRELNLQPGPLIGELLEAIREAQASGEIDTYEAALELARSRLSP
jgi:tRNA nucleotidyltransferase/poly(A) polymerase